MSNIIKSSKYISLSLGLNVLMLLFSLIGIASYPSGIIFLVLGVVVIGLFFISLAISIVYPFMHKSKLALKYRLIPLYGNLSMFILFPAVQSLYMALGG